MIKEFKRNSNKISKKTILSCMVIAAITSSNCTVVKAMDTTSTNVTALSSNQVNVNGEHKFIIDAHLKVYDDINKAEQAAGFKFKVPNFLPEGNKLGAIQVKKVMDKNNIVQIYYDGINQVPFDITFQVSKTEHVEALKKMESEKMGTTKNPQIETKEEDMKLGGINGKSLTLSITSPSEKIENGVVTEEFTEIYKYFIWENEGLSYSVKYNSVIKRGDKTSKNSLNLSEDIIKKIAESIKYPEEAKGVDYSPIKREVSTEIGVMDIYDKEDLEKAKGLLGFNPKLPLNINQDINIKDSGVGISYDSDIKNNKINYELNSFYTNKSGSITFWEGKNSKEYDEIKKNGYHSMENWKTNEVMKLKADKLNINNKEVFKYEVKPIEQGEQSYMVYTWNEDSVYYSVVFFGNTPNSDEIVKGFVDSKPIS
jgi:bla regulator protein blaR1